MESIHKENKLICEKLQITNDLNGLYCEIHDSCVVQKLGDRLDYISLLDELNNINIKLQQEMDECKDIYTENNDEAKRVIEALNDYQNLLHNRINALQNILNKLHNKAEAVGEKYSFFAYRSDMKNLNKLEKQVDLIGLNLQVCSVVFMRKYH